MNRRQQLLDDLRHARDLQREAPSRSALDKVRACSRAVNAWDAEQARLLSLGADVTAHLAPVNPLREVKLVDAAGTLRLDLNGRRTFLTREQGLDLMNALAEVLK